MHIWSIACVLACFSLMCFFQVNSFVKSSPRCFILFFISFVLPTTYFFGSLVIFVLLLFINTPPYCIKFQVLLASFLAVICLDWRLIYLSVRYPWLIPNPSATNSTSTSSINAPNSVPESVFSRLTPFSNCIFFISPYFVLVLVEWFWYSLCMTLQIFSFTFRFHKL